ncbi:PAS domain S-box protein [Marinilabilia rubra]|uniref:Histidine kinase n=1 Tax=Marinilabilia rubra TaxID=2162893 RepID=A0A2U2B5K5_9BACT|nr:PAS domain S-box protein [Marinilabilia rubra]PWD98359.1 hypothetical protein DDZ16_15630 [Marinilabilia rubra]
MPKDSILYIDDEPGNLTGFTYTFKRYFDITTALSAKEALAILDKQHFKVIISDQRMPEITGLELFARLNETHPDAIQIILSAYADNAIIIKAINDIGIYRFLTKPWDKDDMEVTIRSAIDKYNLKNENQQLIQNLQKVNSELHRSYSLLEESEEKFRNIFNQSRDAIVISDIEGTFIDLNPMALDFIGYTIEEARKLSAEDIISPKSKEILLKRRQKLIDEKFVKAREMDIFNKKGKKMTVEIQSQLLKLRNRPLILSLIRDISDRKQKEREILKTIIDTEEKERTKFSAELHDGMGPLLSTLNLYMGSLKKDEVPKHEKNRLINEIQSILDEAITTTKEISNNLKPSILNDFGLIVALNAFIQRINSSQHPIIELEADRYTQTHNENIELNLYRIATELINNTLKHARATEARLSLASDKNELSLNYCDNGLGFDLFKTNSHKPQHGLKNIASRVSSINGTLEIKTAENKGFKIKIQIPEPNAG